ncbi:MAG: hypothetical protein SGBAC_008226 [Bacillariaceae sp.]
MTETQEPDVNEVLEEVGSPSNTGTSDYVGGGGVTPINAPTTPASTEEMSIPSPVSVVEEDKAAKEVAQKEEHEPNFYQLTMAGTYVDEVEPSTDEDGHVYVNSDSTGLLSDGQEMEDAAMESEYDGILQTESFEASDATTEEVKPEVTTDDDVPPISEENESSENDSTPTHHEESKPSPSQEAEENQGTVVNPKDDDGEAENDSAPEKEDEIPNDNDGEDVPEYDSTPTDSQATPSIASAVAPIDTGDMMEPNNVVEKGESLETKHDNGELESASVVDQPENDDDIPEETTGETSESENAATQIGNQETETEPEGKDDEISLSTEDGEAVSGVVENDSNEDDDEDDDHAEPIDDNTEPMQQPQSQSENEESSIEIDLDAVVDTKIEKEEAINNEAKDHNVESNLATVDVSTEVEGGTMCALGENLDDTDQNGHKNEEQGKILIENDDNLEKPFTDAKANGDMEMQDDEKTSRKEHSINNGSSLVHTGSKTRSAPFQDNDDSSSWRGVVIGLTICFFFIIAAQGITIGVLRTRNDDDGGVTTNDRDIGSAATNAPTIRVTKTAAPTVTPTLGTGFRSIANDPGAVRLELISDCSEVCTESFAIPDAFALRWSASDYVSIMSISNNGNIMLECDLYGICGIIETLGHTFGMNVDTSIHGDIFVLPELDNDSISTIRQAGNAPSPTLTVSFEKVQLSAEFPATEEFQVSAQVTLSEGRVEICYGEEIFHGGFLVASFLNITQDTAIQYPDGDPFSAEGFADRFPSNQCFVFEDTSTLNPTPSSSPEYTPYPASMAPTNPTFGVFVSLALVEDAIPLRSVSNCDDCTENIELPAEYLWDGKYPVSTLLVSSNGFLTLVAGDGRTEYVRINVISMDLDTSRDNNIKVRYFRREPSGVTFVSWENMQVFDSTNNDTSRLNGQVLIHPEGRIDICWGEMFLDNELLDFESNIYGYVDGRNFYATGPHFDSFGQSNGESLPQNTCQTLVGDSEQNVSTLYPSEFAYLSALAGSERLEIVSTFDDDEQIVELDVPIRWVQNTFSDRLLVTSNGVIRIDGCPSEFSECGEIAVASADLDPSTSGSVWFFDATQLEDIPTLLDPTVLYVISWEDVSVYSLPSSRINAQALFYDNGTIEICFGEAESFEGSILAGVFDRRFDIEEPAWGKGVFSFGGFTEDGAWPTGSCQSFYVATSTTQPGPTLPPISPLTPVPTDAPVSAPRCMPTSGACVSTESALARELNEAREGDTIALCGDVGILRTISVVVANITLCCLRESSWCSLDSAFEQQTMSVSGADFTVTGIQFQNGFSNQNGGNLAINAPGHHTIRNCLFVGGQTSFMFGGNLYVANGDSISISDCNFDVGRSPLGGSGVAFENTWSVEIRNSNFRNNFGQGAGGGVLVHHTFDSVLADSTLQQLFIENSVFEENSAEIGGGLAVQDVDAINMTVFDTVFAFNVASVLGGALSVTGTNSTVATIRRSSGEGNSDASNACQGFFFDEDTDYADGLCFGTEETVLISDNDFPQDQTAVPPESEAEVPICTRSFPACADSEDDLKAMLLDAQPSDVLSLCGGMVSVSETLQVSEVNITICCEAYPRCTLSGTNLTAPIMSVTQGGNFTATGIRFESGINGGNGGNLAIDAPGYHSIQFCEFVSGFSEAYGGSLYVGNAQSVFIANSHFNSGMAIGGGAAAFVDTAEVSIEESEIVDNSAGFEGGGLFFLSNEETAEMRVRIVGTAFEGNSATGGGVGFAVIGRGSVQFTLLDSWFYDNGASAQGAAGKISASTVFNANFEGNYGDFNVDTTNRCEWIFIENESGEVSELCFNVNLEASFPPSPTSAPSSFVTMGSSPFDNDCPTTVPNCYDDAASLTQILGRCGQPSDAIALCSGSIVVPEAIDILHENITLYCDDEVVGCEMVSEGSDRILTVTGSNATLRGIRFTGGASASNGGNVALLGFGNYTITNCTFAMGVAAAYGGGLSVANAGWLYIKDSFFLDNVAGDSGGGLASLNTKEMVIDSTVFEGNDAVSNGGGVFFTMNETGSAFNLVDFVLSVFQSNRANSGGGFAGSALGTKLRFVALGNRFDDNAGGTSGSSGALENNGVLHEDLIIQFADNMGGNNLIGGSCNGYSIMMDQETDLPGCINTTEDFSYGNDI